MNLPLEIKNKIESLAESYSINDLKKSSASISDKYHSESGKGERLVISKRDVLTYAITRMPATFAALTSALEHSLVYMEEEIHSVLDLGSGTGSGVLACSLLINNKYDITCLEREDEMIDFVKSDIDNRPNFIKHDNSNGLPSIHSDLVIASYFLNELDDASRDVVLNDIWNNANKYILIVEPGTPEAFKLIKYIRDYYLSKGGCIVGPCPHSKSCPLSKDDWCHFVTRVTRSRLHKLLKDADVPYEDEKFSYICIAKSPCKHASNRLLRHPIIKGNSIAISVCNENGTKIDKDVTKKDKETFKLVKKLNPGDSL